MHLHACIHPSISHTCHQTLSQSASRPSWAIGVSALNPKPQALNPHLRPLILGDIGTVRDSTLEIELVLALLSTDAVLALLLTDAVLSRRGVTDEGRERERLDEESLGDVGMVSFRVEAGARGLVADHAERGAVREEQKREKVGVAAESWAEEGRAFLAEWREGVFEVEKRPRLPMVPDLDSMPELVLHRTKSK